MKGPPSIVLPVRYIYIIHERPTTHIPTCQVCLYPTSKTHHPLFLPVRYVYILHQRPTTHCSYLSGMFMSYIKDPPPIVLPVRYIYILHQRPTAHCSTCQVCLYPTSKIYHPLSYLSGTFISYIKDPLPIVLPLRYVFIILPAKYFKKLLVFCGMITLDDTVTNNETYEMSKPMASLILSRCSVNTFGHFYASHFNRSLSVSVPVSVSLSANTP